jgi:vitamin K-dependent gamma-carboxylase
MTGGQDGDAPELIRHSHELARRFQAAGHPGVEVFAHVDASLNGRRPQRLVDPTVDLVGQPARFGPHPWVLPLTEPLPHGPTHAGRRGRWVRLAG